MSTAARPTPPWAIVTLREVMVKARDRSYLISTLVTLVLIVGSVVFNAYMSTRADEYTIAVPARESIALENDGEEIVLIADEAGQADGGTTRFEVLSAETVEQAEELVSSGEADAALTVGSNGWTLTGDEDLPSGLQQGIADALRAHSLEVNAINAGTTPEALLAGSEFQTALLNGNAENQVVAQITGFVFGFLFYMAAIIFGMAIATSVLEEKQNRVVEILATAIPIRQLLYGKVAGNTVLAMIQLALYAGAALLALTFTDTAELAGSIIPASGWFLLFFLVGFLILASLWAMIGSMASRSEDLNNSSGPVLTIIIVALFAGLFAKGQLLVVASYVPVISTVAMPVRMLSAEVPLWETLLSLAVALAAAYALLRFGERIYRRAVMQSGGALTLRKAMKLEA